MGLMCSYPNESDRNGIVDAAESEAHPSLERTRRTTLRNGWVEDDSSISIIS